MPGESRAVEARLGALPRRLRGYIEEAVDVAWNLMRCDAGTWGGRTEFVHPTIIVPPFVLLLGRQAVFTHVVFHLTDIQLLVNAP